MDLGRLAEAVVRKVGEGYDRPDGDSQLPVDIKYDKLQEWLVDRRQVPTDWVRRLQAVQAQAAAAVAELPPGFLAQLEGGEDAPLNYARAKQVLERLAETAEKSLLGSYKGAAGVWGKLVHAYESNPAQALARNVDYEIPFHKKQVARAQQQLADFERKKADSAKSAAAAAAEFQAECAALGVDADRLRPSLLALAAELPTAMGEAVALLWAGGVTEALEYYRAFVELVAGPAGADSRAQAAAGSEALLPTLAEVRAGGTVPPTAEQLAAVAVTATGSCGAAARIDWGPLGGGAEAAGEAGADAGGPGGISWDLDAADLSAGAGEAGGGAGIAWDVEAEAPAGGAADAEDDGGGGGAAIEISWDIGVSDTGEGLEHRGHAPGGPSSAALAATAVEAEADAESAAPAEALSAALASAPRLPHAHTRHIALARHNNNCTGKDHDLLSSESFVRMGDAERCAELSSNKGSELLASGGAAEAVQHVSADVAARLREAVSAALTGLESDRLRRLLAIRTSARFVDRLAASLEKKAGQEAKFLRAGRDTEARRGEVQRQLMADSARLAALVREARAAKAAAEVGLGAKLGRRVNIMGELP
eukprot:scaffold3.g6696.t1